jgi:simple sugar transport system permease protein
MILLITSILAITISAGASLLYATLGEIHTERSGILNLGVEGMMLMGALAAFATAYYTQNLILALLAAMIVGGLTASLHAFLTITMQANQVVSGLGITLFGAGLSSYLGQQLGPASNNGYLFGLIGPKFTPIKIPILGDIPIISAFFNQDILIYFLYILVPLAWFYIYKTRNGINLRAIGQNPNTAAAMGINVNKERYLYTILGGVLVGIGGAHLSLAYTPGWTENITGGRGWIVIALVIFAMWNPARAVIGAILFGGINAVQFRLQAAGTTIPASFLNMLPYLVTILVLVLITVSGKKGKKKHIGPPAALGKTFIREDK